MKQIIISFILGCALFSSAWSQSITPRAFNYSAVARDLNGTPIANGTIGIQISILKSSPSGAVQYTENHTATTDNFGLFNLVIGSGAVQMGSFSAIEWHTDTYFLEIGMDVNGGTNFAIMGTSQLLSVPYALHAATADSLVGGQHFTVPVITTLPVSSNGAFEATAHAEITNIDPNHSYVVFFIFSTVPFPQQPGFPPNSSIIHSFNITQTGDFFNGNFSIHPDTTYYIKAAIQFNNAETFFGNTITFMAPSYNPQTHGGAVFSADIVTSVSDIGSNAATIHGDISNFTSTFGTTNVKKGYQYSLSPDFMTSNGLLSFFYTGGAAGESFSNNLNHILPNTTYYVRAFAERDGIYVFGNTVSFTTMSIGQTGPGGGIVFYAKSEPSDGWQYLEVAPADLSAGTIWGCLDGIHGLYSCYDSNLGEENCANSIIAECPETNAAARLCSELVSGGQSDWYLPNGAELYMLHKNMLPQMNLQSGKYWSSEKGSFDEHPRSYDLYNLTPHPIYGHMPSYDPVYTPNRVRAIRKF